MSTKSLDELCVNTIRTLSMDAVQAAESGHPGMPMGMADAAYVLWNKFLRHNPQNPDWYDRDRFVLSAGHGSMLLYSLLHLTGYDLPLDELKNFRQWGSLTPGHPEYGLTPGVETTTGPLGQGFATGVGMAIAEAHMSSLYNTEDFKLTDHYVYGIVSDGDLMEGISHEAASLAGHLQLGKIIYLYDSNNISIDGSTDLAFTEDVNKRFKAYNWHVQEINGHDHQAVENAIKHAQKASKPSIIVCNTHIGFGSPNKQDSEASHGAPLGEEEVALTKENLGWDSDEKFYIPDEVKQNFRSAVEKGKKLSSEWNQLVEDYKSANPEKGAEFVARLNREFPADLEESFPVFPADEKGLATRASSGKVLNAIEGKVPALLGGSADLHGSNKTWIDSSGAFSAENYSARNMHYGVREHAMGAAMNGIALHGGVIPYGGTFLIFSDYCRPAIRIAALSEIPSIFVMTHDSIGLGEDGPTHQPIEHLSSLRAMPNLLVLRPADANEVSYAWKAALEHDEGPSMLVLTRQNLPTVDREVCGPAENTLKGAYILSDSDGKPDVILMGSGSEVQYAMEAQKQLAEDGIAARVVSMPSWELFEQQGEEYIEEVLPSDVKARVSIEAGSTHGWHQWVGSEGKAIGIEHFGASAPYETIYEEFGLTSDRMVKEAKKLLKVSKQK
ncbi:transketolase [Aliifodinibius sp. S!AR15-10]|uniref:transketolase n=1 Tax=Aliifodinibius sp. S!AR15-10 TaxID=2950437 RepID=UPI00285C0D1F|nr:transketolase [Aliifodinibius sp. S!AR15-10]MDR8390163.1 transketolase [Aliifodinibius sp. S!AR15-10]